MKKAVRNTRKPLNYNGKVYVSARAAAAGENIARSTVLRHVKSIKHPNVFYIEEQSYGQTPIFAKKNNGFSVLFNSMGECVNANYASTVQYAHRQIKQNAEGWRYAHLDSDNKPLRIPYKPKPGEVTYEQYCEIFSFLFLINSILASQQPEVSLRKKLCFLSTNDVCSSKNVVFRETSGLSTNSVCRRRRRANEVY